MWQHLYRWTQKGGSANIDASRRLIAETGKLLYLVHVHVLGALHFKQALCHIPSQLRGPRHWANFCQSREQISGWDSKSRICCCSLLFFKSSPGDSIPAAVPTPLQQYLDGSCECMTMVTGSGQFLSRILIYTHRHPCQDDTVSHSAIFYEPSKYQTGIKV